MHEPIPRLVGVVREANHDRTVVPFVGPRDRGPVQRGARPEENHDRIPCQQQTLESREARVPLAVLELVPLGSVHCQSLHQFVRVGTLALMQGGAAISKDLPPFTVARGDNGICGLNTVGLRRAGFTTTQRLVLKKVYHALFRSGLPLSKAISVARAEFSQEPATILLDFVANSRRGVVAERRLGRPTSADRD